MALADAPSKHLDESGWKQVGQRCWSWAADTSAVACFVIRTGRDALGG